jgi:hypothetical protein
MTVDVRMVIVSPTSGAQTLATVLQTELLTAYSRHTSDKLDFVQFECPQFDRQQGSRGSGEALRLMQG